MKKSFSKIAIVISILAIAALAEAGVVITQEVTERQGKSTSTLYIEGLMIRQEHQTPLAKEISIYRGDKGVWWIIELQDRSYSEITEADLEKGASQMLGAMEKMERELSKVSPEERKMMEAMMKGMPRMTSQEEKSVVTLKKVGTESVEGYACEKCQFFENGVLVSEVWATPMEKIGLPKDTFRAFERLAEKMERFAKGMSQRAGGHSEKKDFMEEIKGFPVKEIEYSQDGKVLSTTLLKKVEKQALEGNLFEIPKGFKKGPSPFAGAE